MSKMMKKMAVVENLMAKRPSGSAIGTLPHSNDSSFTGVTRRGPSTVGSHDSRPATPAQIARTIRIGTYCMGSGARRHGGLDLPLGVVGRPHERPRLDVLEAEAVPQRRQGFELVGRHVARHRQVGRG